MVYGRRNRNRKSGPSLAIHNAGDMGSISGGGIDSTLLFWHYQKRKKVEEARYDPCS